MLFVFTVSFGLSYTSFSYENLTTTSLQSPNFEATITFTLTNTGSEVGSEATQVYISPPTTSALTHAPIQLKAFKKIHNLEPGKAAEVVVSLDKYAVSYWDERNDVWIAEKGEYGVFVGASSADLKLTGSFKLDKTFTWVGL